MKIIDLEREIKYNLDNNLFWVELEYKLERDLWSELILQLWDELRDELWNLLIDELNNNI